MKARASVNELSSIVHPQVGLFWGPENRYLEGWGRFSIAIGVGPVAAVTSAIRYRNSSQNTVVVFEKLALAETVSDQFCNIGMGATAADLAAIFASGNIGPLDPRGQPSTSMIVSTTTNALGLGFLISGTPLVAGNAMLDDIVDSDQQITLLPGQAIQATATAVNTKLLVAARWRERTLGSSELK